MEMPYDRLRQKKYRLTDYGRNLIFHKGTILAAITDKKQKIYTELWTRVENSPSGSLYP